MGVNGCPMNGIAHFFTLTSAFFGSDPFQQLFRLPQSTMEMLEDFMYDASGIKEGFAFERCVG